MTFTARFGRARLFGTGIFYGVTMEFVKGANLKNENMVSNLLRLTRQDRYEGTS